MLSASPLRARLCGCTPDLPALVSEFNERFTNAVLNFCAGKPFHERMQMIAFILDTFGNLEAAGDNPRGARVLFDASSQITQLGKTLP